MAVKHLIIDAFGLGNQTQMEYILHHRGRIRDQFTSNLSERADFILNYVLANILAQITNTTLITNDHHLADKYSCNNSSPHSRILPIVKSFGGMLQAGNIWNCSRLHNSSKTNLISRPPELPLFIRNGPRAFNFAYCLDLQKTLISSWNFTIFTDPFDVWTWVVLISLLFLVSWLVSFSSQREFVPTFMSALAALLDNEMVHVQNSKLYVLWLFTTLLIFDFYSGAITSQLIVPPEETLLSRFADLERNNFTIIFNHKGLQKSVQATVHQLTSGKFIQRNAIPLILLAKNSKVMDAESGKFFPAFTSGKRVAIIANWAHVMWYAAECNKHIATRRSRNNKKCHVGKELLDAGPNFIAFIPPGNKRLAEAFRDLITAGIVQMWRQECDGIYHSRRVQDRVRVKTQTSIAKDETTVEALRMEGRLVTIFLLWILGLAICSILFAYEFQRKAGLKQIEKIITNCKLKASQATSIHVKPNMADMQLNFCS